MVQFDLGSLKNNKIHVNDFICALEFAAEIN